MHINSVSICTRTVIWNTFRKDKNSLSWPNWQILSHELIEFSETFFAESIQSDTILLAYITAVLYYIINRSQIERTYVIFYVSSRKRSKELKSPFKKKSHHKKPHPNNSAILAKTEIPMPFQFRNLEFIIHIVLKLENYWARLA